MKPNTIFTHMTDVFTETSQVLILRSRTEIGINETRLLFVLNMIVLNLLDEGRRTYSLCKICVLSLNCINYFIGFTQYLLFIQSIESGFFETCYSTTNVYNALQIILVLYTVYSTVTGKCTQLYHSLELLLHHIMKISCCHENAVR